MIELHGKVTFGDKVFNNTVTVGMCEFITKYTIGTITTPINYIYVQYGVIGDYPEGGGPFFTPSTTDTITDLIGSIEKIPILMKTSKADSGYVLNVSTYLSMLTNHDGDCVIGAGLVNKIGADELLVAHVATDGILKVAGMNLGILWEISHTVV